MYKKAEGYDLILNFNTTAKNYFYSKFEKSILKYSEITLETR